MQPLEPQIQRFKLYYRLVNFKTVKTFFIFCLKVWEMAVLQPSEPENLMFNGKLSFCCPRYNGGSRISVYEVSCYFVTCSLIKVFCIRYIFKMM